MLRSDAPQFSLLTFALPVEVVGPDQISAGERFLSFTGGLWCCNVKTPSGATRVLSRHVTINAAIFSL